MPLAYITGVVYQNCLKEKKSFCWETYNWYTTPISIGWWLWSGGIPLGPRVNLPSKFEKNNKQTKKNETVGSQSVLVVDHLLLLCKFAHALWSEVFLKFGVQWVMPSTMSLFFCLEELVGELFFKCSEYGTGVSYVVSMKRTQCLNF